VDGYVIVSSSGQSGQNPDPNPDPDPPSLKGDLNGDGVVDIADLTIVAKVFGCEKGLLGYDGKCDLDENGLIDIVDVSMVGQRFGLHI
jgi:hypothetical protein